MPDTELQEVVQLNLSPTALHLVMRCLEMHYAEGRGDLGKAIEASFGVAFWRSRLGPDAYADLLRQVYQLHDATCEEADDDDMDL